MSRLRARQSGDAGLALIELLVAMFLLAVVGSLTTDAIVSAFHSQLYVTTRAHDLDSLRQAMQRTTRDLRQSAQVCYATNSTLMATIPVGASVSTVQLRASGNALVEDTFAGMACPPSRTQPTSTATVLGNYDPAASGPLFAYQARAGYQPPANDAVAGDTCADPAHPGTFAVECVGDVVLRLSATVPSHPDISLTDTVSLRTREGS